MKRRFWSTVLSITFVVTGILILNTLEHRGFLKVKRELELPIAMLALGSEVRPYNWTPKWSKIMKRRGGLAWRPDRSRLLWGVDPIVGEIDGMSSQIGWAGLPSQPLALELGWGQVS